MIKVVKLAHHMCKKALHSQIVFCHIVLNQLNSFIHSLALHQNPNCSYGKAQTEHLILTR